MEEDTKHISLHPKWKDGQEEMGSNRSLKESIWAVSKHLLCSSTFTKIISNTHKNFAMYKLLHHLMARQPVLKRIKWSSKTPQPIGDRGRTHGRSVWVPFPPFTLHTLWLTLCIPWLQISSYTLIIPNLCFLAFLSPELHPDLGGQLPTGYLPSAATLHSAGQNQNIPWSLHRLISLPVSVCQSITPMLFFSAWRIFPHLSLPLPLLFH